MFKNLLLWIEHLFGMHIAGVPIPPPPTAANPAPITFSPPAPSNPAFPPLNVGGLPAGYGPLDVNGFCTVDTVEAMRAEIAQKDPAYHLAHFYLCPAAIATIADPKARIAAQWQASQVAYWNLSAIQGGNYPFYPGVVVEISVRPGMESTPDDVLLKWLTVKGPFIDAGGNMSTADHVGIASQLAGSDNVDGIAAMVRAGWIENARGRNLKFS